MLTRSRPRHTHTEENQPRFQSSARVTELDEMKPEKSPQTRAQKTGKKNLKGEKSKVAYSDA